jgi:hypothetical protein
MTAIVEFDFLELGSLERGEIVLAPDVPIERPTLYASVDAEDGMVEEIIHGEMSLAVGPWPFDNFRFGRLLQIIVSSKEPLKIIVSNQGKGPTRFGASLVKEE